MPCLKAVRNRLVFAGYLGTLLFSSIGLRATTLNAVITSNLEYEAFISPSGVLAGTSFLESAGTIQDVETGDAVLTDGIVNYLHIATSGFDFSAALIGTFTLSDPNFVFPNGLQTISTDAVFWKLGLYGIGYGIGPIADNGPDGTAPWGSFTASGIAADARFIARGENDFLFESYFSLPILPANASGQHSYTIIADSSDPSTKDSQSGLFLVAGGFVEEKRTAFAGTDPGRLKARTREFVNFPAFENTVETWVEFTAEDIQFINSTSLTDAEISLNLTLEGWLWGGAGFNVVTEENEWAKSAVEVLVTVNDTTDFSGQAEVVARRVQGAGDPVHEVTSNESGLLDGFLPDTITGEASGVFAAEFGFQAEGAFTTPPFTVNLASPLKLRLRLSLFSTASTTHTRATSELDFSGGLAFPTIGDVFNLPDGVTVSSVSANIKNNRFEAGGDPPEPEKVFVEGMFLQVPDIEGESEAIDREGWIDLTAASSSVSNPSRGLNFLPPLHGGVVVSKYLDLASPLLAAEVSNPTPKDMVIEVNDLVSQDRYRSFQYRLKEARVSDYQVLAPGIGEPIRERVTLAYSYVDWVYDFFGPTGPSTGGVSTWWDLATNTGGSTSLSPGNQPPSVDPVGNQPVDPGSSGVVVINLSDQETAVDQITASVSTTRPDLIGELKITGTGAERQVSFITTALRSGLAPISVEISDGTDIRTLAIPVLIDAEMTPFEGFLAAHFPEAELYNPTKVSPILDPDFDGLPTLVEFLLGTNPAEANLPFEAMQISQTTGEGGRTLLLEFKKRLDEPNIQGFFWGSFDMKDWTRMDSSNPLYEESGNPGENPLYGERTGTITLPAGTEPYFIRYQVQDVF